MSELPDLPQPERRAFAATDERLDAAIDGGLRRRRRFLATTAGASTTLALILFAVVAGPGAQRDSLQPATVPTSSTSPDPDATGVPNVAPTAGPSPSPGQSAGSPLATASPLPGRNTPSPRPDPGTTAQPTPATSRPPTGPRPAFRERTDEDADGDPSTTCIRNTPGACAYNNDNGPILRRGGTVTAVHGGCFGPDVQYTRVHHFAAGQETEVAVTQEGREIYRLSAAVTYVDGPHSRRLRPGRCLEWMGSWDGRDTDGAPVPAGVYTFTFRVLPYDQRAEPAGSEPPENDVTSEPMTFQVTLVD